MPRRHRWALAAFGLTLACGPARAQSFDLVALDTLGGSLGMAVGTTPSGDVAGWSTTPPGVQHATLWADGGPRDLGVPPGYVVSRAVAVNDAGQVAGNGEGTQQDIEAHLWEDGAWTPLGVLPGRSISIAEDIGVDGRVVGRSLTPGGGDSAGFVWEDGSLTDLGSLGGVTEAHAINSLGEVVGGSRLESTEGAGPVRAFLWLDGVMDDLGVLAGEDESAAFGVNDRGDVVGSSWHVTSPIPLNADQATLWRSRGAEIVDLGRTPGPDPCVSGLAFYTDNVARAVNDRGWVVGDAQCVTSGAAQAAFLWVAGVNHNLNDLVPPEAGWQLLSALDVGDDGRIVGFGLDPTGRLRPYLLVPQPIFADGFESGDTSAWSTVAD